MTDFCYYYLRSMRLYYCFVTGMATLAGCVYRHGFRPDVPWDWRDAAVIMIGFLAWGVNQIISDWFDRKEDAVNAPHRPMVSGKLAPCPALILSGSLMALFAVVAYLVSPLSLVILIVGGLLNILYSLLKGVPVINTLIYGAAITCCTFFGLSAHLDYFMENCGHFLPSMLCFWVLPHVLMCHNSYFKDIEGDRAAGLRTLPVLFPRFSLWLGMILSVAWSSLLATPFLAIASHAKLLHLWREHLLSFGYILLVFYLTFQLFRHLRKKDYHSSTRLNCQLCVAWLWMIPTVFSRYWLIGMLASVLMIEILYRWYPDEKE